MTDDTDTDRTDASAERIAQLEQQVERLQEQVDTLTPDVSRRQALQGGAAVGLGALLGGGATLGATQSARAAPDADDVGAANNHVDVYAQNLYDVDGQQYDRFSEAYWIEDSNSPHTNLGGSTETINVADMPDFGALMKVFIRVDHRRDPLTMQVNGKTSGYNYIDFTNSKTTNASAARIGGFARGATHTILIGYDGRNGGTIYRSGLCHGKFSLNTTPGDLTFSTGGSVAKVRVLVSKVTGSI